MSNRKYNHKVVFNVDSVSDRASVVGGVNDDNGSDRGVSTAEQQPNVQCALFLMKLARV